MKSARHFAGSNFQKPVDNSSFPQVRGNSKRESAWHFLLALLIAAPLAAAQEPLTPEHPTSALPAEAQSQPLPAAPAPEPDRPLTLAECYALALKRSEDIAIQTELIKQTEAQFLQALSGVLPRASYEVSKKRQDGTGSSAFTLRDTPERRFAFSQPLFGGFKEFAAMAGSRAERRQRLHERRRAEDLLFVDVANAFYLILEQQEDLRALAAIRGTLVERIDELKQREQLGRSRTTDAVSAEAQLRRVEAEMEQARTQEVTARKLLEFLTGLSRVQAVTDPAPSLLPADAESAYVARAAARPDVQAAEDAWRVAQKEVTIARAGFFPDVDLEGNYYTRRVGNAASVEWDVTLLMSVPIFQGGQNLGAVREARSSERQAKLTFERRQRQAALDVQDAYAAYTGALARHAALARALEATEQSYRLQVDDYRLALVNNLDVLQTLQTLEDSRRETLHAGYEAKRLSWQLEAAAGNIAPPW